MEGWCALDGALPAPVELFLHALTKLTGRGSADYCAASREACSRQSAAHLYRRSFDCYCAASRIKPVDLAA